MRALAGLCLVLVAAGPPPDPIDAKMKACLSRATNTNAMVSCTGDAIHAWDAKLNETYQQALRRLDPKSADLLRTSQQQWVAFRDAEHATLGGPWAADRGTIIRTERMYTDLTAIKERVSELKLYSSED